MLSIDSTVLEKLNSLDADLLASAMSDINTLAAQHIKEKNDEQAFQYLSVNFEVVIGLYQNYNSTIRAEIVEAFEQTISLLTDLNISNSDFPEILSNTKDLLEALRKSDLETLTENNLRAEEYLAKGQEDHTELFCEAYNILVENLNKLESLAKRKLMTAELIVQLEKSISIFKQATGFSSLISGYNSTLQKMLTLQKAVGSKNPYLFTLISNTQVAEIPKDRFYEQGLFGGSSRKSIESKRIAASQQADKEKFVENQIAVLEGIRTGLRK